MTKAIKERMAAIAKKIDWDDPEQRKRLAEWEKAMAETVGSNFVKQATDAAKSAITAKPPLPVQMLFSFMPTQLTRTSPFFPMSRQEMKDRPYDELTWETSWGTIRIEGKRLSIQDESVLLCLLLLVKKYKTGEFETTQNELCKIAGIHTGKNTYKAIWESIKRLAKTTIDLDIYDGKGAKRKTVRQMTGSILMFGDRNPETGKLRVVFNPYFLQMYVSSFVTTLNLEFRANLKGDITKALYRFYEGQREHKFSCRLLKLAQAININTELPKYKIRHHISQAHKELKKARYLNKATISAQDVVTIWKANKMTTK